MDDPILNNITPALKEPVINDPEKKELLLCLTELIGNNLAGAITLPEFYEILQKIIFIVNDLYENIQCKTGCNRCCKFYGSPQIYKFEWDYIKDYLQNNFDQKQIKRVYRKFKENIDFLKNSLENETVNEEINNNFAVSVFLLSECPFLYKGSCSIYEARPLICRIFGNSLISRPAIPVNQNVLTCSEERQRWQKETVPEAKIFLPGKEDLESILLKMTNPEEQYYNTIQYWLTEYFNEY